LRGPNRPRSRLYPLEKFSVFFEESIQNFQFFPDYGEVALYQAFLMPEGQAGKE